MKDLTIGELEELVGASQEMLGCVQSAFLVMNTFAKEPYGPVDRPMTAISSHAVLAEAYANLAVGYARFEAAVPEAQGDSER